MADATAFQQAANLLQVLKDLDLLKVACALAANNCAVIIDQASTQIPRSTLTAIFENSEYNSKLLNNSITPFTMVQHEFSRSTPSNSVTTITTMQLVTLTTALLKGISGFLQPATLQTINWQRHVRAVSENRSNVNGDYSLTLHVRGLQ
jgi:hypothetical protein